jgi:hypothetical protein
MITSKTNELPTKKQPRFNFLRENHRNWVREGTIKIISLPGNETDAKRIVRYANASENLKLDNGLKYLNKI